ncbi:MAG: hypothetical protein WC977_12850 [Anaerovoracaceae bacterium]
MAQTCERRERSDQWTCLDLAYDDPRFPPLTFARSKLIDEGFYVFDSDRRV